MLCPQSPITNHQSPVPSPQSPVPSPQSPVPSPQSPVPSHQSPIYRPFRQNSNHIYQLIRFNRFINMQFKTCG
ncbi:MAG: hypothetical protein ACKPEO_03555 [Sphaerospermopsis kisseleviana]